MHGGFRSLRHPATWVDDINIEGTRQERQLLHQEFRRREALLAQLLAGGTPGVEEEEQPDDA
jgi:hypothetical protein